MRNDARPIGRQSPVGGREPVNAMRDERQSPIVNRSEEERRVNRAAEEKVRRVNPAAKEKDPTMPSNDSTLNTKI